MLRDIEQVGNIRKELPRPKYSRFIFLEICHSGDKDITPPPAPCDALKNTLFSFGECGSIPDGDIDHIRCVFRQSPAIGQNNLHVGCVFLLTEKHRCADSVRNYAFAVGR